MQHMLKVEQLLLVALTQQLLDSFAQPAGALSELELSEEVDDHDALHHAGTDFDTHAYALCNAVRGVRFEGRASLIPTISQKARAARKPLYPESANYLSVKIAGHRHIVANRIPGWNMKQIGARFGPDDVLQPRYVAIAVRGLHLHHDNNLQLR